MVAPCPAGVTTPGMWWVLPPGSRTGVYPPPPGSTPGSLSTGRGLTKSWKPRCHLCSIAVKRICCLHEAFNVPFVPILF